MGEYWIGTVSNPRPLPPDLPLGSVFTGLQILCRHSHNCLASAGDQSDESSCASQAQERIHHHDAEATTTEQSASIAEQGATVAPTKGASKKGATPKKSAPKSQKAAKGGKAKPAAPKKEAKTGKKALRPPAPRKLARPAPRARARRSWR
jgi:hypothetical protein